MSNGVFKKEGRWIRTSVSAALAEILWAFGHGFDSVHLKVSRGMFRVHCIFSIRMTALNNLVSLHPVQPFDKLAQHMPRVLPRVHADKGRRAARNLQDHRGPRLLTRDLPDAKRFLPSCRTPSALTYRSRHGIASPTRTSADTCT